MYSEIKPLYAGKLLRIRLDSSAILFFVSLLPLVVSGYVDVDPALSRAKSMLTVVSYALILLCLLAAKGGKWDTSLTLTLLLLLDLAISTFLFQGVGESFIRYIAPLVMAMLLWVAAGERQLDSMLAALNALSVLLIYANAISLVLYPSGIYSIPGYSSDISSFLGHNNAVARTTVPLLLFGMLHSYRRYGCITVNIVIRALVVFATAAYTASGSGVVGTLPMLLLALLWGISKKRKLNAYVLFGVSIGLWICIEFAQFGLLEYVITDIFQKDPTLTGRTLIWERALGYIGSSPIFGYGYSDNYLLSNGFVLSSTGQSAHNYYLDLLLRGGVLQLALQLAIVFVAMRAIEKRIRPASNELANLLSIGLFSYFLMWLIEPFTGSGVILMFSVFFYVYRCSQTSDPKHSGKEVV